MLKRFCAKAVPKQTNNTSASGSSSVLGKRQDLDKSLFSRLGCVLMERKYALCANEYSRSLSTLTDHVRILCISAECFHIQVHIDGK